jgi:hypothetical protein
MLYQGFAYSSIEIQTVTLNTREMTTSNSLKQNESTYLTDNLLHCRNLPIYIHTNVRSHIQPYLHEDTYTHTRIHKPSTPAYE